MQWFWIAWMQSWHLCLNLTEFYRHVLAELLLCGRLLDRAIGHQPIRSALQSEQNF